MTKTKIRTAAIRLSGILRARNLKIAIAESCTGGLVAAAVIALPGASDIIGEAYVVYSDAAKTRILGIDPMLLETRGAVSIECAGEMARNLEKLAKTDVSLSITGFAGPTGETVSAPVGTVCFGISWQGRVTTYQRRFSGDRNQVQDQAVVFILEQAVATIENGQEEERRNH